MRSLRRWPKELIPSSFRSFAFIPPRNVVIRAGQHGEGIAGQWQASAVSLPRERKEDAAQPAAADTAEAEQAAEKHRAGTNGSCFRTPKCPSRTLKSRWLLLWDRAYHRWARECADQCSASGERRCRLKHQFIPPVLKVSRTKAARAAKPVSQGSWAQAASDIPVEELPLHGRCSA